MSCQVRRNNNGQIEQVLAPNKKESVLYKSILELPEINGDKESALLAWAKTYTPSFKAWFGDFENSPETASKVVDENGEPLLNSLTQFNSGEFSTQNDNIYQADLSSTNKITNVSTELSSDVKKAYKSNTSTSIRNLQQNPGFLPVVGERGVSIYNSSNPEEIIGTALLGKEDSSSFQGFLSQSLETLFNNKDRNSGGYRLAVGLNIVNRLLQETNSFNGRMVQSFFQNKLGNNKLIRIENDSNRPTFYADGQGIYININGLDSFIDRFDNYEDFLKGIELILSEELIHHTALNLSTKEEIKDLWNSLNIEEQSSIKEMYSSSTDPINLTHEYIRMIIQNDIFGTTSELETKKNVIKLRSIFRKVLDYLVNLFKNSPTPYSNEVITKVRNYINKTDNAYYQKESSSKPVDPELDNKIKVFLEKIGVDVKILDKIKDKDGNPLDVVARASMLNKIIEVVEGRADITTLSEEAAHFFIEMLPTDSKLLNELLDQVVNYKLYKETIDQYIKDPAYQKNGKPDFVKIKKEAAGKLVAAHIIAQETNGEKPERLEKLNNWFRKLWKFISDLFTKVSINPFESVANSILSGNIESLDLEIRSNEDYYQLNTSTFDKIKQDQSRITLDNSIDIATGQKRHIYKVDGQPTKGSVTSTLVDAYYKKIFPNVDSRNEKQKEIDLLKAEYGDNIHADFETIMKSLVDPDTGLVRAAEANVGNPVNSTVIYEKLKSYIKGLVAEYEPGTKFMTEVKVHDPIKNIAGSIDLLILKNDGSADIYDWKSQEISDNVTELKSYKIEAYRIQLKEYREILRKFYGLKVFNKIRAIPIRTKYHKTGKNINALLDIEIGPYDPKQIPEDKRYLLPITLQDEKTNDEKLDELVEKLYTLIDHAKNRQDKASSKEREVIRDEISQITAAISDLQVRGDLKRYTQLAISYLSKYHKAIKSGTLTDGDIKEAGLIISNIFMKNPYYVANKLEELTDQINKEKDVNIKIGLEKLKTDVLRIANLASEINEEMNGLIDKRVTEVAGKEGITNLKSQPLTGWWRKWFASLSNQQTGVLQTFWRMFDTQNHNRDIAVESMNAKISELKKNLESWATNKGISYDKMFDGILDFNEKGKFTGRLLSKYKKDFYQQRAEAIKNEDAGWFINNVVFDKKAYNEALVYWTKYYNDQTYSTDPQENLRVQNLKIENWKKYNEGEVDIIKNGKIVGTSYNIVALANNSNKFIKPADTWKTDKWISLMEKDENKSLKEVYEYFREMTKEAEDMGLLDEGSHVFIPSILKSGLEKLAEGNINFKTVAEAFSFLNRTDINNDMYHPEVNPISGVREKSIPKYFQKNLGEDVNGETDYSKMSTDLFMIYSIWGTHMYNYKGVSEIEDTANLLVEFEKNQGVLVSDKFGNVTEDRSKEKPNPNAQMLEQFIDYSIYGKTNDGIKDVLLFGKYSGIKTLRALLQFYSFKTLGLNPVSGTSQFVGGIGNSLIQAGKGKYFSHSNWTTGMYLHASQDKTGKALSTFFLADLDLQQRKQSRNLSTNKTTKYGSLDSVMDNAFVIQRGADKAIMGSLQNTMFISHMFINDKIVSIKDYVKAQNNYDTKYSLSEFDRKALDSKIEKEIKEYEDKNSLYVVAKNNNGVVPGLDRDSVEATRFRAKIKKVEKKVVGNMSHEDINLLRTTILGTALMTFRSWIPEMALDRFSGLQHDIDTGEFSKGRYRTFIKEILSKRLVSTLGVMAGYVGTNAIENAKAAYIKDRDKALSKGISFDISEADYIDMYVSNIRAMLNEVILIMGFMLLCAVVRKWKDDDDDDKAIKNYVARATFKYYNEFSFFVDPREFSKIAGNSIPIMGLALDAQKFITNLSGETAGYITGDDEKIEKNHPGKYLMRFFPITNQVINFWAAADDDFRKEWDVRINPNTFAF